jgi:hypothetical protein
MANQPDGIFNEIIDAFFGGSSDDPRIQKAEVFQIAQHFDIWTEPKRLTPYPAMVSDDTFAGTLSANVHKNTSFTGDVVAATDVFTFSSTLAALGLTNASPVLYTGVNHDVFVQNTTYYVGNISGSTCKLYSDVTLLSLMNATIDTAGMTFTGGSAYVSPTSGTPAANGLYNGLALVYTGATAGGLTNGNTYYVGGMTSALFLLYNDSILSTLTTISANVNPATFSFTSDSTLFKIEGYAYENSGFFAAGRKQGTTKSKVYQKPTGSAVSGAWQEAPSGEDSNDNAGTIGAFIAFHDYVYGGRTLGIWAWGTLDPAGTFTATAYGPSGTPSAQGIITADDLLIIPLTTALAVKNGAGSGPTDQWSTPISFSATNRQIKDTCEWGDFVAIALHPGGGFPANIGSKVALWDKVNADPSHTIDWGEGHLLILDNLEGTLVGVSQVGYGEEGVLKQKIVVRQYTGGDAAQVIFELEADAGTTMNIQGNKTKVKDSNRLIFGVQFTKDGVSYFQNMAIGRKSAGYPLACTLDRLVNNTSTITAMNAQYKLGQTIFTSYNTGFALNKTDPALSYTTSSYISQKLTGAARVQDAARRVKKLLMAGVQNAKLPSGSAINLYHRVDGATAWTLIRTYTQGDDTTNSIVPADMGFEAGSVGASNDEFPNYKELEFKATCTGGASITGFVYSWQFSGAPVSSV